MRSNDGAGFLFWYFYPFTLACYCLSVLSLETCHVIFPLCQTFDQLAPPYHDNLEAVRLNWTNVGWGGLPVAVFSSLGIQQVPLLTPLPEITVQQEVLVSVLIYFKLMIKEEKDTFTRDVRISSFGRHDSGFLKVKVIDSFCKKSSGVTKISYAIPDGYKLDTFMSHSLKLKCILSIIRFMPVLFFFWLHIVSLTPLKNQS